MPPRSDRPSGDIGIQADDEHGRLLEFLYRCPVGIIEMRQSGDIQLINAYASQMLMPLATHAKGADLSNLLTLLAPFTGEIRALVDGAAGQMGGQPAGDHGVICTNHRVHLAGARDAGGRPLFLGFTIHRIQPDSFLVSFYDDSIRVAQEAAIAEAIEVQAHQAGRIEIAANTMHDIGNAMSGLGGVIGRLSDSGQWRELEAIRRLVDLFRGSEAELSHALGPGKGPALIQYVEALTSALAQREDEHRAVGREVSATIHHVQDVLTIQRQLARDGSRGGPVRGPGDDLGDDLGHGPGTVGPRRILRVHDLVHDALVITESSLSRRQIRVEVDIPAELPPIAADRTRMLQVLVNLLGNATDAFETLDAGSALAGPGSRQRRDRRIQLRARLAGGRASLRVRDNGPGFEPGHAARLMERGESTKPGGTGLGLATSRATVEAYGGSMQLESEGPGHGAQVTIELPCCEPGEDTA